MRRRCRLPVVDCREIRRCTGTAAVNRGVRLVRAVCVVLAVTLFVVGCSRDKPATPAAQTSSSSEEILKRNCADPKWKEQNLGLWYSVCRPSLPW